MKGEISFLIKISTHITEDIVHCFFDSVLRIRIFNLLVPWIRGKISLNTQNKTI